MKSITLQDYEVLKFQNQFTKLGNVQLNDPKRIYYITRIKASGNWNLNGKSNSKDPDERFRSVTGSGTEQFYIPLCFDTVDSMTGVQETNGFWSHAVEF